MAKKRSSRDDDDDEDDSPRRKRQRDDEDDDDDAPRKRRRKDDDDDEEEDRPRKRRRAREEEDDGDSDDELEELSDEDQEREILLKKAHARAQLLAMSTGMTSYRLRAQLYLYFAGGFLATFPLAYLAWMIYTLNASVLVLIAHFGWLLVPQMVAIKATRTFRTGPKALSGSGLLYLDLVLGFVVQVGLFFGANGAYLFMDQEPLKNSWVLTFLGLWFLGFICYFLTFIVELFYLRRIARYLKDKVNTKSAQSVAMQHMLLNIASLPVMGLAGFFLYLMGTIGLILIGIMVLVFVLLVVKGFFDMMSVCDGLCLTISKRIREEDKSQW